MKLIRELISVLRQIECRLFELNITLQSKSRKTKKNNDNEK